MNAVYPGAPLKMQILIISNNYMQYLPERLRGRRFNEHQHPDQS